MEMQLPRSHAEQSLGFVPSSTTEQNWTIHIPETKTIKVSNISVAASVREVKEFFSFSGDIHYIEMRRESDTTQVAYVTFKDSQGADTALMLSGSMISNLPISISPVDDYQLPPEAPNLFPESKPQSTSPAVKRAEEAVSTMLAKGFVLGKDALQRAKSFDERHQWTSNASATVASIDSKMGVSRTLSIGTATINEMVKEINEWRRSAFTVAEQKASSAGSAIMTNSYFSTGASWVSYAFNAVAKAAGDVGTMTKEKVERAEENKRDIIFQDRAEIINNLDHIYFDRPIPEEARVLQANSGDSYYLNNI